MIGGLYSGLCFVCDSGDSGIVCPAVHQRVLNAEVGNRWFFLSPISNSLID
jgi:hypothetical protein